MGVGAGVGRRASGRHPLCGTGQPVKQPSHYEACAVVNCHGNTIALLHPVTGAPARNRAVVQAAAARLSSVLCGTTHLQVAMHSPAD